MVDGIEMVFSKQKMIDRLTKEGREGDITSEILAIMDNFDGQPVGSNSWNRQVMSEPVYTCTGKDGKNTDVNEEDCVSKKEYECQALYNKGNDCDCCNNQYLCGRDGDATGCKCFDRGEPCHYDEAKER